VSESPPTWLERRLPRRRIALLAALLCAASVVVTIPAAAAANDCVPAESWPAPRADLAAQVVDLINAHRAQLGLQPLAVSPTLTAAATWKARHMAAYVYMAHDDPAPPDPRTPSQRLAACGYPQASWGENIASGFQTAQDVVNGWLASPGHRANIERAEYRATGAGVAGSQAYWAQSFGTAVDAGSTLAVWALAPLPEATPAAPRAASGETSSTHHSVKIRCGLRVRRVTCRVGGVRGATVRIALTRGGHTYARARARVTADPARLPLQSMRQLRDGHYRLMVRAALGPAVRERRIAFLVR
jgi:uncharacterized protein YkwD